MTGSAFAGLVERVNDFGLVHWKVSPDEILNYRDLF
jgi:hypothetical protein